MNNKLLFGLHFWLKTLLWFPTPVAKFRLRQHKYHRPMVHGPQKLASHSSTGWEVQGEAASTLVPGRTRFLTHRGGRTLSPDSGRQQSHSRGLRPFDLIQPRLPPRNPPPVPHCGLTIPRRDLVGDTNPKSGSASNLGSEIIREEIKILQLGVWALRHMGHPLPSGCFHLLQHAK